MPAGGLPAVKAAGPRPLYEFVPSAEEILAGYDFFRRRTGALPPSEAAVRAALAMATDLAAGVEEDALAALLFAFASYRRAFPGAWRFMATSLALAQARRLGRTVAAPRGELEELLAYCRQHLSTLKCPRSIDFEAELPRHPTGKLYKRLLRDRYWGNKASRIV